ncbi:hypothetical protein [Thermococcus aciditolerans]|uniref:Uncharacterized protein n=1 Tax=Thermococcus aciditolerans TaxID=2598455 RepID=A0A5C0SLT9_9EURY|nr:hypothetical protein [Thermococcus aciditolerans]QEK14747.1 hypothetical protein FPV09_06165 [Thermococcus aciditolerans]
MASDVEKVVRLFQKRETQEAFGEWVVQLARKIHEKPEDIVWFFEMRQRMREVERLAETITDEELEKWERELEAEQGGIDLPLETLLEMGRRSFRKFKRIEAKLKELGVV